MSTYLVNGGANAPDWLSKGASKRNKNKSLISTDGQDGVRLLQDSDFPEASNRIKTTRDGKYIVATGTYKPRIKVLDLDELGLKFERITDAETLDFEILSDDWTKTLHVQSDRTVELHDQRASFYRTRIPTPGRSIGYHFPTCDALVGGQGGYVCRLNLEAGRFLAPFALAGNAPISSTDAGSTTLIVQPDAEDPVTGVNVIDVNPAHQLLAFGTETALGKGTVELWDPRSRERAGLLALPYGRLSALSGSSTAHYLPGLDSDDEGRGGPRQAPISVTALASRFDGLNMAVGTSTGHTLLYDLRSPRSYALKDQGYGLPVKRIQWAGRGDEDVPLVASADEKVIKIWSTSGDCPNLVSINPANNVNDMHIVPDSGLLWLANEGSPLTAYYVPQLGPAPKWCRFLDNMTEEMEETNQANVYEDYKFIDRQELRTLNLDHLIGTPALRPYMHGFFVDLRLYTKARAIANPFQYADYRDRLIAQKLDAERDSRIRTSKADEARRVKVNRALVERLQARDEAEVKSGKKRKRAADVPEGGAAKALLADERFGKMFEDREFEVDTASREYALLNPSVASQNTRDVQRIADLQEDRDDEDNPADEQDDDSDAGSGDDSDSSAEGDLVAAPSRPLKPLKASRISATTFPAPIEPAESKRTKLVIKREGGKAALPSSATIGDRLRASEATAAPAPSTSRSAAAAAPTLKPGGVREYTFVPDPEYADKAKAERKAAKKAAAAAKADAADQLGVGMRKGSASKAKEAKFEGEEASGRQRRRKVGRSASKTAMRATGSR